MRSIQRLGCFLEIRRSFFFILLIHIARMKNIISNTCSSEEIVLQKTLNLRSATSYIPVQTDQIRLDISTILTKNLIVMCFHNEITVICLHLHFVISSLAQIVIFPNLKGMFMFTFVWHSWYKAIHNFRILNKNKSQIKKLKNTFNT